VNCGQSKISSFFSTFSSKQATSNGQDGHLFPKTDSKKDNDRSAAKSNADDQKMRSNTKENVGKPRSGAIPDQAASKGPEGDRPSNILPMLYSNETKVTSAIDDNRLMKVGTMGVVGLLTIMSWDANVLLVPYLVPLHLPPCIVYPTCTWQEYRLSLQRDGSI